MMSSLTMILTIDSTNEFCCKQCLDSIFRQTKNNFELVLLQDEKATFSMETISHSDEKPIRIKHYIYSGAFFDALSQVISTIESEYVTIVHAKDWIEPTYVENFQKSLRTPEIDIIVGNYSRFLPESSEFLFHVFGEQNRIIQTTKRVYQQLEYLNSKDEAYRRLGNTFIKTSLLKSIKIPNLSRVELEESILKECFQQNGAVLYHHQADYVVRILPEETENCSEHFASLNCISDSQIINQFTNPNLPIKVLSILDTLHFIETNEASVARFGDGEMEIMTGQSIPYQDYDETLAHELRIIYQRPSDESFVVCQSDVFESLERYNEFAQNFWINHLSHYEFFYRELSTNPWYGSTFISRPYMDLMDKSHCTEYFDQLRRLWQNRDVLMIEGKTSRSGVGNDLFDNAKSITRIIGPSCNAYQFVDDLEIAAQKYGENKLILLMLGPTAKVLSYRLAQKGYWAIDIGHIDSEYEWFKMGATSKVKLPHKHTAEHNFDENIIFTNDPIYDSQIVAQIY